MAASINGIRDVQKPIIAITMGDAAGIGPEIIVKVLSLPPAHARAQEWYSSGASYRGSH